MKLYHKILAPNGREFGKAQGESLMAMSNNGGWTKTKEDGVVGSKKSTQRADKQKSDTESSKPREEA